eukprot:1963361-Prorocentrum_lima.AAC.1
MNNAGNCCQGWSSAGPQKRFAHPSEIPHACWLTKRKVAVELDLEDGFFEECTVRYPWVTKLREPPIAC